MPPVLDKLRPDLGGNIRHGDSSTFCPKLWRYLIDRFAINSMLDVGCGEGHAVKFFQRQGVLAHGIDGLRANIDNAVTPIALHDLLLGPYVMPVDLVWSCEVAEHILEEKLEYYLQTLANGKLIAITHALPGQIGHHHVNCQPAEYWVHHIERLGYRLLPHMDFYRQLSAKDDGFNYFQKSGLLFARA